MSAKLICILIMYLLVFTTDFKLWKKANGKEIMVLGGILTLSAYVGIMYITGSNWANLDEILHIWFKDLSMIIVTSLQKTS